ncbi:MAG: alanine--tRNA ligase [Candidatus Omnitrophota bacterium]|nr:MAG: alanine--tRNA ligase [Candidatus Omnitrophota bacterium]
MKTDELRKNFLDFFKEKDHVIFPSDSLVPHDTSLLFTSAGMNQFKPYFLGEKKHIKRAASCQRCLRTGDLEEVGRTPYHHTFFEMLGNFSFGDYFKKETIEFAWEFLCKNLNMKKDDLWVSVYREDEEAYQIWKDYMGVEPRKIIKLGQEANFWPAQAPLLGPNGPCGPCSEIFFDKGKSAGCQRPDCSPGCDCSRFVEVWNLVFTQFNRVGENKLEALPQKNIDTGMGLERMASVLQGKNSNFQIDILAPLVENISGLLSVREPNPETVSLINAIVDHGRAVTFAICDGVFPSNEERGYIVRKLIRKAVWKANLLGRKKPFLYELPSLCADLMRGVYPQVYEEKDNISQIVLAEEEKFLHTLGEGRSQFSIIVEDLKKKGADTVKALDCFRLYDTYGFPLELSKEIAAAHNLKVDEEGFTVLLKEQQDRSRKKSMFAETIFEESKLPLSEVSRFSGYELLKVEGQILQLIKDNKYCSCLESGQEGLIVLDSTPFYPESGGQLTDKGIIKTKEGQFKVEAVFKVNEAIVHQGRVVEGRIVKGIAFACVDSGRRAALMRAHTATHLLQAALRQVLGPHVMQQGSLVDEDRLRFDFTHFNRLTDKQIKRAEEVVNEFILRADPVKKRVISYTEAKDEGALAFFKDKYGDSVRVVSISDYSKELCGGTHLDNTAGVGFFSIVSESSISSGVRRIEAVVGRQAYDNLKNIRDSVEQVSGLLRCKHKDLKTTVARLMDDLKKERAKNAQLEKKIISWRIEEVIKTKKKIKGRNFLVYSFTDKDYPLLLYLSDLLKKKIDSVFMFFISSFAGKDIFVCSVSADYIKKGFTCKKFISTFSKDLFLKGGGRDSCAQGVILSKPRGFLKKLDDCIKEFLIK